MKKNKIRYYRRPYFAVISFMALSCMISSGAILPVKNLLLYTNFRNIDQGNINGIVTDEDNQPIPGVNVIVKGKSKGTATDFDGKFSLDVSEGTILVLTSIGYATKEVIASNSFMTITLMQSNESLGEVVVTALGLSKQKRSLSYSVGKVDANQINTVKDYNVANSLVGKVAGLNITQAGGVGTGSRITIRGNNSLTGNTQALVVVDGIPINQDNINTSGNSYNTVVTGGGITDINPSDIASISVLKGPNAAALYGSRAGNGVLVITTKKGHRGKQLGITLNTNITLDQVMFLPKYQNQYGQGTLSTPNVDLAKNFSATSWGGKLDGLNQLYFDGTKKPYVAYQDNVKKFFQTGVKNINTLTMSKGGEGYSVRFSYTNNATSSILPNSSLSSHNFNLRANIDLSDKWNLDSKGTYFEQNLQNRIATGSEGVMANIYYIPRSVNINDLKKYQINNPSVYPGDDSNPNEFNVISPSGPKSNGGNPYWDMFHDKRNSRRGRFIGFSKLTYKFNDWLSMFGRIGGDVTNINSTTILQPGNQFQRRGTITLSNSRATEFNSDFLLMLNKDVKEKLNIQANLGGNLSIRTYETYSVLGSQFKLPTRSILSNTITQVPTNTPASIKKVNSLYGSTTIGYDNFVFLDLTARNDWSSTLAKNNRSIFYSSAGISLLVDKFIDPNHDIFDMVKLRGSWAQVGNDTDTYQLYQTYSASAQTYLGLEGLNFPTVKLNPNLKAETVTSKEVGLEVAFLKNRLSADISYYTNRTTDLIFDLPVPGSTGYAFFKENIGEVENSGYEITLNGTPLKMKKFNWDVSIYAYHNKNRLVSLKGDVNSFQYYTNNTGDISIRAVVGGSIGDIYGKTWKTDDKGNKIVDANGIPVNSSTPEKLGNIQPDFISGLTNTFTYSNLSLRVLIDGRFGGEIYSATSAALDSSGVSERTLQYRDGGLTVDAFLEDGTKNNKKITAQQYWGSQSAISGNYIYSQTNVRLREFALSYTLPKSISSKLKMDSTSIGLIGRNLFFIYKDAPDIDPEANLGTALTGQGINSNNIPTTRSLGFNVTLKF